MIKVLEKVYNNRVERKLVSCILEIDGYKVEKSINELVSFVHNFYNATGVYRQGEFFIRRKVNFPEIPEKFLEENFVYTLWHGTKDENFKPKYNYGRKDNDYGVGLYTTENLELAKEWAMGFNNTNMGYVYQLSLNIENLKILDLNRYPIETWLAILFQNRCIEGLVGIVRQRRDKFIEKYMLKNIKSYDIIIGYRADDSYFKYAEDFLNVAITKGQLEQALYLGDLGQQVFIQSEETFKRLKIVGRKKVSFDYHKKFLQRDKRAREMYLRMQNNNNINGETILDLL